MPVEARANGTYRVRAAWRQWPQVIVTVGTDRRAAEDIMRTLENLHSYGRRDIMQAIKDKRLTLADVHLKVRRDPGKLATLLLSDLHAVPEDRPSLPLDGEPDAYGPAVGPLVRDWLEWARSDEGQNRRGDPYRENTLHRYENSWRKVFAFLGHGDVELGKLEPVGVLRDPELLKAYRKDRRDANAKRSTLNRDMDALRAFWRWVITERVELGMPAVTFAKTSEKEQGGQRQKDRIRCLSLDELRRMEAVASPRWQSFFSALYQTGLRVSEMQGLLWGAVTLDGDHPTIQVEGEHLKTESSHRAVALTERTVAIFRARRDALREAPAPDEPVWDAGQRNYATVRSAWVRIRARAKLGRARVHDLRHTYGGQLVRAGVALPIIKTLMGHSSARTTMRYLEFADEKDTAMAARLLESHLAGS